MRIVIAPDSFKGSLAAPAVAKAMATGVLRVFPTAEVHLLPLADGGEGTLEAVLVALNGERHVATVTGGHGKPLEAAWGQLADGTAVVEAAQVVGLTLPDMAAMPIASRTTAGLGELLRHCLGLGVRRFWVGLGGSATNDGGVGMLAALGVRFRDHAGKLLEPKLENLNGLAGADFSTLDPRLQECDFLLLSDVDNPLLGPAGATAVFGPQKGVLPGEVARYDRCLEKVAQAGDAWTGRKVSRQSGSGAAGGLGYAFLLLGGKFRRGAEEVGRLLGLDATLAGADWAITGEGRSDSQTLHGKAPLAVAKTAKAAGVPLTLLSGQIAPEADEALAVWFGDRLSLVSGDVTVEQAMSETAERLADLAERAARRKK